MAAKHIDDSHTLDFEEISDSSMMAILVYHQESMQPIYMNRLAIETLEFGDQAEMAELYIERLYPDEGKTRGRSFSSNFIHDAGFYQDIMMKKLNGNNFIANLGVRLLQDSQYLMLMFQDVTFQKKLQREVQVKQQELMRSYTEILEQNAELQTLSEAKDKLITLSSHELRTPLSAIIAMTETLELGVIEDPEEQKQYFTDIHREGNNLMNILNSMLDVLKFTTGKAPYFINENSMTEYLSDLIPNFHSLADTKSMKIAVEIPEDDVKCYFDTTQLKKAFQAVIENAIKFSPNETHVRIRISNIEKFVRVEVIDQGPGIPEDFRDKIFDEFTTGGDIDTHSKGAGLSLTIAKLSTEQQGGKIYIDPEHTNGTSFIIEIPKEKILDEDLYSDINPYEDIEF